MAPRAMAVVVLALVFSSIDGANGAGIKKLYWTDWELGQILRSNPDGTDIEIMLSGLNKPTAFAIDPLQQRMYWTERVVTDTAIRSARLNGAHIQTHVVFDAVTGNGLAVDPVGERLYWTFDGSSAFDQQLQSSKFDGSDLQTLTFIDGAPFGVALDLARGKVYFTDGSNDEILRANLDGSDVETVIAEEEVTSTAWGIDVDSTGGKVYWTASSFINLGEITGGVVRADLDGSSPESLYSVSSARRDIVVDEEDSKVYWVSDQSDLIARSDLDGSNLEFIITGVPHPRGVDIVTVIPEPTMVLFMLAATPLMFRRR